MTLQCSKICAFSLDELSVCVGGPLHLATDIITAFAAVLFIYFNQIPFFSCC